MVQARRVHPAVLALLLTGVFEVAAAQAQTGPAAGSAPLPTAAEVAPSDPAALPEPPLPAMAPRAPAMTPPMQLSPQLVQRFRTGRALHVTGAVFGLLGNGLTLTSLILTSVYGLDSGQGSPITQVGPALAYAGTGAGGAAFILSATGVGLQHSALNLIGQDPGRGLYGAGTALGVLGLCGIGTSYFFRFTNYVDNSPTVAFGTALAAAVLLTAGGIILFSDGARVESVYRRLTSF